MRPTGAQAFNDMPLFPPSGECMWLDAKMIQNMMEFCQSLFPVAKYATSYTPTYPLGQLGYVLCGMDQVGGSGSVGE